MAKKRKELSYIPLYFSMEATLARLNDEQFGRLLRAALHYAATGELRDFPENSPEFIMWPHMQDFVDRHFEAYREKCEINRENGMKAIQTEQEISKEQGLDEHRKSKGRQIEFAQEKAAANKPERQNDWRDLSKDRLH